MIKQSTFHKTSSWFCLIVTAVFFGCGGGEGTDPMTQIDAAVELDGSVAVDEGASDAGPSCECAAETTCTDDGECVVCTTDNECADERICESGACSNGCADDAACEDDEGGAVCLAGRCVQCGVDDDCFGGATCSADSTCTEPDV